MARAATKPCERCNGQGLMYSRRKFHVKALLVDCDVIDNTLGRWKKGGANTGLKLSVYRAPCPDCHGDGEVRSD